MCSLQIKGRNSSDVGPPAFDIMDRNLDIVVEAVTAAGRAALKGGIK